MTLKSKFHLIIINSILILCFFLTTNCGIYKPADARKIDPNVNERVKKNIEEGRGFRVMGGKKIKVAHLNLLPQMQCGELRLIC